MLYFVLVLAVSLVVLAALNSQRLSDAEVAAAFDAPTGRHIGATTVSNQVAGAGMPLR